MYKRSAKAALRTKLLPHQQRVLDKLRKQTGLLVAHGLGSGKTFASIAAASEAPGNTEVLAPASLVANYEKEMKKHLRRKPKMKVRSAQGAALRGERRPASLLIVDEAHRARETSTKLHQLLKNYPADKKMLLTATPVYNRPSDIAPLVNIVAQEKVLPYGTDFDYRYVQKPSKSLLRAVFMGKDVTKIKNKSQLQGLLNKWVDYHKAEGADYPDRIEETIDVPMDKHQTELHDFAWGKLPLLSRMRLKAGLPPSKQELPAINRGFQAQTRQLSGTTKQFGGKSGLTPKLQRALDDLQSKEKANPDHRAVVYSNYLDTLGDYSNELESKGISHGIFTGKVSQKKRKQMVEDYNSGRLKALLISSAGGEGLDLKGTRQVQVLEPHWNEEKLDQVIGRAVRQGSHSHLPKKERNVTVQRYLTYPKPGMLDRMFKNEPMGVERVLANMSADKKALNAQLLELMEQR